MKRSGTLNAFEEEAIEWLVEMRSGSVGSKAIAEFERWLAADARHQQAWQRLGGALDTTFRTGGALTALSPGTRAHAVDATLSRSKAQAAQRRRMLRGALSAAGLCVGGAWLAEGSGLVPDWRADLHTATGQRRSHKLTDGSQLELDARTSVDIDFNEDVRLVRLRQGQLRADVQRSASRPFIIQSVHGDVRALGARVMVRHEAMRTLAVALDGGAALSTGSHADQRLLLRQGSSAYLDGRVITAAAPGNVPDAASAWVQGMLHAENMALGEVLASLKPYRNGFLRVSPAAAQLRVTGVYSLDDSDATLRALSETLPIEVHRDAGGWLVSVNLKS